MRIARVPKSPTPLAWADRPVRELLRLTWPFALSYMSLGIISAVDIFFVARLGTEPLAGVGISLLAVFLLILFPSGVLRGGKVRVSQTVGADDGGRLPRELGATLGSALGLAALALGAGFLILPQLPSVAPTPGAGVAAHDYFSVWLFGVPAALFKVSIREFRYGVGDSRGPMAAALCGNAMNFGLDPLFMFSFGWGVQGAALATVVAHHVELGVLLFAQRRSGHLPVAPRWSDLADLWAVGLPIGLQVLLRVGALTALGLIVASLGAFEMAAHQVTFEVTRFVFLPAMAMADAASVLTGQAVGAKRYALVWDLARRVLALVLAYAFLCSALLLLFAERVARVFSADPELASRLVPVFWIAGAYLIFDAANVVARFILRGAGDVRIPATVSVLFAWILTPPAGYFLGRVLGWGVLGAWVGLTVEAVLTTAVLWWRLAGGHWRRSPTLQSPLVVYSTGGHVRRRLGRHLSGQGKVPWRARTTPPQSVDPH